MLLRLTHQVGGYQTIGKLCKVKVKVKVKFTLEQAMKAHRGSRDIALLFL